METGVWVGTYKSSSKSSSIPGERDNVEDAGVNGECGGVAPNNPMEEAEVTNTGGNVSEADESMEESAA